MNSDHKFETQPKLRFWRGLAFADAMISDSLRLNFVLSSSNKIIYVSLRRSRGKRIYLSRRGQYRRFKYGCGAGLVYDFKKAIRGRFDVRGLYGLRKYLQEGHFVIESDEGSLWVYTRAEQIELSRVISMARRANKKRKSNGHL